MKQTHQFRITLLLLGAAFALPYAGAQAPDSPKENSSSRKGSSVRAEKNNGKRQGTRNGNSRSKTPGSEEAPAIASQAETTSQVQVLWNLEPAQSWYEYESGSISWRDPLAGENLFLSVNLRETVTSQALHGCRVTASMSDSMGKDVFTSVTLAETWTPGGYLYGANLSLGNPVSSGTLKLKVDPPAFRRMDKEMGTFFLSSLTVSSSNVDISSSSLQSKRPAPPPDKGSFRSGRRPLATPTPYPGAPPDSN